MSRLDEIEARLRRADEGYVAIDADGVRGTVVPPGSADPDLRDLVAVARAAKALRESMRCFPEDDPADDVRVDGERLDDALAKLESEEAER